MDLRPDGHFIYIPFPNTFGIDTFAYAASDGTFASDPTLVSIDLIDINQIPLARADSYELSEDTPLVIPAALGPLANDTDGDNIALSFSLVGSPEHGQLTVQSDGSLEYVPHPNFFGTDQFTYRVFDGVDFSLPAIVTLHVAPVPDPLLARDDVYVVRNGETLDAGSDLTARLLCSKLGRSRSHRRTQRTKSATLLKNKSLYPVNSL